MTKKLLLTAAALGAMAFAGAASAGVLSAGSTVSGVPVTAAAPAIPGGAPAVTAATYTVASEYAFPAAGLKTDIVNAGANAFVFNRLTNEINVDKDASGLTFVVTYDLTGPAKFENVSGAAVNLGTLVGTVTPVLSNGGKTLKAFVTVSGNGANTVKIDSVRLANFDLAVTGKEAVKVNYTLQQVIAGQNVDLDSSNATNIVTFGTIFDSFFAVEDASVLAALDDFEIFNDTKGLTNANVPASGATVTTLPWETSLRGSRYIDLQGAAAGVAVDAVIRSAEVTLTGPQVKTLKAKIGTEALPADATATSATYELDGADLDAFLVLAAQADTAIDAGSYKVIIKPTYETNWAGPASLERDVLTVGLDGTNLYAPWFALDNGVANSTLRLANNGSAPIGPIVVSLKANNGAAAPTGTYTIPSIAPGAFVSVRGDQLKAAFGTTAANGDLMVTVQSQDSGLSAKVRSTQSTGQVYENSLGTVSGN